MHAKEIARGCRLTLPTAYHLLRTLCYEGYLIRQDDGTYVLGWEIAGRFRQLVASMGQPPGVHEVLRHLAETTGHTAYYAQLLDGHVVVADLVEGPKSPYLEELVVGFDEGAHATAIGKAVLGMLPRRARQRFLQEHGLRPFTANTIVDADRLAWELRAAARTEVFTQAGQFRAGVGCVAVPLGGAVPASIGLSAFLRDGLSLQAQLVRQLRLAAADLSRPPVEPIDASGA